jgi:DegV family protein with EDD domain
MADTAVLVNASCDLPRELMELLGIICVPNRIGLGERTLLDDRDAQRSIDFFDFEFDTGKAAVEIEQPGPEGYLAAVQQQAVMHCDELLVLTPLRDLAAMYDQVQEGTATVASRSLSMRAEAGRKEVFRIHIEDSRSLFTPNGVLAWEAAERLAQGQRMEAVRAAVNQLAPRAYGCYLPDNLKYIASRARDSRDKPGAFAVALGSFLDVKPIARRCGTEAETVAKVRGMNAAAERLFGRVQQLIEQRQLLVPKLLVSYGGNPEQLAALPGFAALQRTADAAKVQLRTSVMSMAAGVFLGRRAISVGLVAHPHEF